MKSGLSPDQITVSPTSDPPDFLFLSRSDTASMPENFSPSSPNADSVRESNPESARFLLLSGYMLILSVILFHGTERSR
ncbi:MAG TPA: hypothetical protein PL163_18300 [Leptospiraceae bacterium]|nr:hypothetical protein [Leptospiraceae bacterium]